jgi:hypothetical protein
LKSYQLQVKNSDGDGKLRCQGLKFWQRLYDKYRFRHGPEPGNQILRAREICLQKYDRVVDVVTPKS